MSEITLHLSHVCYINAANILLLISGSCSRTRPSWLHAWCGGACTHISTIWYSEQVPEPQNKASMLDLESLDDENDPNDYQ